jgi:hypothetical protein
VDPPTYVDAERPVASRLGESYESPEELGLRKTLATLAVLALLIGAVLFVALVVVPTVGAAGGCGGA